MCLLDTTDGALMMSLYTSTQLARDPIAICYYSIVLTVITVIVAIIIGTVQFLNLILNVAEPHGKFWDGVERLGEAWDIVGKFSANDMGARADRARWRYMWNLHYIRWPQCYSL
jgi:high-affinity nickel-transport protein